MKPLFLAVALTLAASSLTLAQPSSGGPAPGTPPPVAPTDVPLDGGASLLLASGVALGLKKLRQRRAR